MSSLDRVNQIIEDLKESPEVIVIPPVTEEETPPLVVSGCKVQQFPELGEGFPAKSIVTWA